MVVKMYVKVACYLFTLKMKIKVKLTEYNIRSDSIRWRILASIKDISGILYASSHRIQDISV